ncbi:GNAT family N-acetyltransferase [Mucilaginibacter sp. AK015]|uniref:GNAT family N-acetyltransferase n=1 Tax=Mucilaginibacter sp. AK015 TaxID=2723072 RepID=UPI0017F7A14A|nr:GNAT family N-acetyltransferase [Mucilaginibacter sp. AK015]MBB5395529.1 GNAT superfamily N-acetyltransferase [Mucilaginibacter sp. AK015]
MAPKRFDWVPSAYTDYMQNITIREATLADMDILLQFEQGVISAERPFDPTIKGEHINYYDLNEFITAPNIYLALAELNGQVIGSGYARIETSKIYLKHRQYAYLGFMYVLPQHRGKGVNKLIIQALKNWALKQGITELRLQVYNQNAPAIKAYEKVGFSRHMIEMRMGL